jgi:hypothetical protein
VADLTPALLNSTWQLLTAEARCTLISSCHAAAAAATGTDQLAAADADFPAPDAACAATTLVTALEIVSYGQQRSFSQAAAPDGEAAADAAADAEQHEANSWSEDMSVVATQRAARRSALSASAALAVRSAALEQSTLRPERQQTSSSLAASKQKGWLSFLSSISTGGSTFLRLLFLAATGDVAFFPEVHAFLQSPAFECAGLSFDIHPRCSTDQLCIDGRIDTDSEGCACNRLQRRWMASLASAGQCCYRG